MERRFLQASGVIGSSRIPCLDSLAVRWQKRVYSRLSKIRPSSESVATDCQEAVVEARQV